MLKKTKRFKRIIDSFNQYWTYHFAEMDWASLNTSSRTVVNEYTMLDSFVYDKYSKAVIERMALYTKVDY